ncbi:MAG: radical SAM protein [Euryarchaeota archaeon]|nr:radical SAM protein [Euryarchaeota archaeon]
MQGYKLVDLLSLKESLLKDLKKNVDMKKVKKDEHSRRRPIFCGMTIHPGYGCSLGCVYCYVYDMGITTVTQSKLSGMELVYALLINKYFLPKETLIAVGSITEPFLPQLEEKTYEFIEHVSTWLRNPIQISAKLCPSDPYRLLNFDKDISFLMSFSSYSGVLEPKVAVKDRVMCLKELSNVGIKTVGFIRPIVPRITEEDIETLLQGLKDAGVQGIVLGSLRVTPRVFRILSERFNLKDELLKRMLRKEFKDKSDQVSVFTNDIKRKIESIALDVGLKTFPFACSANIISHGMGCNLCSHGPCGNYTLRDEVSIYEYFEHRKVKMEILEFSRKCIVIEVSKGRVRSEDRMILETYYKVPVKVK